MLYTNVAGVQRIDPKLRRADRRAAPQVPAPASRAGGAPALAYRRSGNGLDVNPVSACAVTHTGVWLLERE